MKLLITLIITIIPSLLFANDIEKISGVYGYEKYGVTMPDGSQVTFDKINVKTAYLNIRKDLKVILQMHMKDGQITQTSGEIQEIHIDGNSGYWLAKWSGLNYLVRKDFSFNKEKILYKIKFDNPDDKVRFGTTEEALITRIKEE